MPHRHCSKARIVCWACAFLLMIAAILVPLAEAADGRQAIKGLPLSRFYSFEEIGDVFRGARLSFDSSDRLAVVQDGAYFVLNDESWIDRSEEGTLSIRIEHVVRDSDGTMFYGARGSWGVLSETNEGLLRPSSFAPMALPGWVLRTSFAEILPTSSAVCFAGRTGIVCWNRDSGESSFIPLEGVVHLFDMDGNVYASTFDHGIFRIEPQLGTAEPAEDHPFAEFVVDHVATLPSGRIVASTFARELFAWDGTHLIPFCGALGARLGGRVSAMQALPENLVAVAVAGMGLYIVRLDGEIVTSLTHPEYRLISSLANNEAGVLWAATESGVAKILYGVPATSFGQALGLPIGWPQFVSWRDQTIIASNGRVFEPVPVAAGEPARFQLMDPQPRSGAWGIAAHGPWLLLGNSDGVFAREPGKPFQLVLGDMAVARLQMLESGECLVLGEREITALRLDSQQWRECVPRISGLGYPAVVHASRRAAWVELGADHAARITLFDDRIESRLFDVYPWSEPRWVSVSILKDLVILSGDESARIYFDEKTEQLTEAPAVEALLRRMPYWPSRIQLDATGLWWVSHPHGVFTFDPTQPEAVAIDTVSYRAIHEHSPLLRIMPGRHVWASNGRTLLLLEPAKLDGTPRRLAPRIVSAVDLRTNRELVHEFIPRGDPAHLDYSENSIGLRFFAGTYASRPTPDYEYRMNDAPWSRLDSTSLLRLSNLREGDYRLETRLVDTRGPLGETTTMAFIVAPPWFRTHYAYGSYALLAGALVAGLVKLSSRRAQARNLALEKLVAERTGELRATMTKLEREVETTATLAERNRMAGEIHDGVEQGFAGLSMQLEAICDFASCSPDVRRELTVALNMLSYSRNEMRHVVRNLYSPLLDTVDLETALQQIVARIAPGLATVVRLGTPARLGTSVEHHLLRIAQEAVANAVKHASPKHVDVHLHYGEQDVLLEIRDDGSGFDPAAVLSGDFGHFGLPSFRGRAEKIGGTVKIASRPGAGTSIAVRVPFNASKSGTSP